MAFPLYNGKFMLLISASFITIFSSIAIFFCLPILISHLIRTQLSLSPTSGSFNGWRLNSVLDEVYLYNITNLDDVTALHHDIGSKKQKPFIKQIGPIAFRQDRMKLNIKFDTKNETVLYDQQKTWTFLPERSSIKTIEDLNSTMITHINIPLAGTTLNQEYAEFIEPIVSEFDLKLFLKHSVNTLLFEGYHDILMEQAQASGQIDVSRFGWMHNQNNSITKNIRIFTGPSNATFDKLGSVDQFAFMNNFQVWHNYNGQESRDLSDVKCNQFRFSSGGEFFPPPEDSFVSHHSQQADRPNDISDNQQVPSCKLTNSEEFTKCQSNSDVKAQSSKKIGQAISLFMPDLCRTFTLVYNGSYIYKELEVDRYIANELTYDYTETDAGKFEFRNNLETSKRKISSAANKSDNQNPNLCYCAYNENTKISSCPPNGMMDIFNCRKGSPLTISFPHFLYSNEDKTLKPYLDLFDSDIEPNVKDHQFFIDLESTLNVPVRAQIVLQFNVHYRNEPSLNFTREYSSLLSDGSSSSKILNDFYLPQMWIKSTAEVDQDNLKRLRVIQSRIGLVTPITTFVMFGFGSILLTMSAKLAYDLIHGPKSRKSGNHV